MARKGMVKERLLQIVSVITQVTVSRRVSPFQPQLRDRQEAIMSRGEGGGGTHVMPDPQSYDHRPSHPYNAGTKHVGFPSTRQTLLAPSAKRRDVLGESHEA